MLTLMLLPFLAGVSLAGEDCDKAKNRATARYYRCLAKALAKGGADDVAKCRARFEKRLQRADRKDDCGFYGGADEIAQAVEAFSEAILDAVSGKAGVPEVVVVNECDLEQVELLDFEAWRRENGYWVGEYTFLGPDGDPNVSSSWPYEYAHYRGFIHLEVNGNSIRQRNIFAYPPQPDPTKCTGAEGEVKGNGICGVNGNEKIFSADQSASDCHGSLAGPFVSPFGNAATYTQIIEPDTVIYKVVFDSQPFAGNIMQNQMTTLSENGLQRVRAAQGFNVVTGAPSYLSFYRERKVSEAEFYQMLDDTRVEYNILPEDECGWDGVTNAPSGTDCATHFAN
ncbi:MAG: hypothetical protein MK538_11775 [Planctomycetes bacterium]|nr:hypothetical protein [Planctomycetota bacterium]